MMYSAEEFLERTQQLLVSYTQMKEAIINAKNREIEKLQSKCMTLAEDLAEVFSEKEDALRRVAALENIQEADRVYMDQNKSVPPSLYHQLQTRIDRLEKSAPHEDER